MADELDPTQVRLIVESLKKLDREVVKRTDEFARRLGIDPENDYLVISNALAGRKFNPPKWMATIKDLDGADFKLWRGVKNKDKAPPKKD